LAAEHILSLDPAAYFRLDEFSGPLAVDASPNHLDALYEPQVLFYLEGPNSEAFAASGVNRAAHFVDDRLRVRVPDLESDNYSISFWFWSGTDDSLLDEVEWLFSRDHSLSTESGDHIGVGIGTKGKRTIFFDSAAKSEPQSIASISPEIERWKWNHLVFSRSGKTAQIFLNGKVIIGSSEDGIIHNSADTFFFGGSSSDEDNFEGKLDEIAIFDRALSEEEIENLYKTGAEK